MAKKGSKGKWDMEPQKSSAAQYLTYIASYGISDEKFEIRYEDENIWMSQKMLSAARLLSLLSALKFLSLTHQILANN